MLELLLLLLLPTLVRRRAPVFGVCCVPSLAVLRPPPSSLSLAGMPSGSCRIKVVFGGDISMEKSNPELSRGVPLLLALSSVRCRFVLAFESLDGGECLFLVVL